MTRPEKHFEELKDSSLPLHIWYQDRLNKKWKSGKLILQGKGYACISPDGFNELTWLPLWNIQPKGGPRLQDRGQTTKTPGGKIPIRAMAALKISRKHRPQRNQTYDLPS